MSVHNSEHNSPINSDHNDDIHDSVTRISKVNISDPLHLHPNDTTTLTVVSIKLKGTKNYQWDRVNAIVLGWILNSISRDCLRIIESKSKVRNSRNKPVVAKVSSSTSTPGISSEVAELKDMVKALLLDKKNQSPAPTPVKAVEESCVTCGGAHSYQTCPATTDNVYRDNIQEYVSQAAATNYNQGQPLSSPTSNQIDHTVVQPPAYQAPAYQAPAPQIQVYRRNHSPSLQKASIPFSSRRNDERRREKANDQIEKFYEIFKDLSFEISFTDALMLMPKFASTLKTLIGNKEKLSEMARTPLNENCSAVILNKLPKKLRDPGRFLIPCEFSGINTCNALPDLGASINLMPYSVWKNLSLPELTPTCMTLELADRSISEPIGIAEDVYVTVGKFQFLADFVVVDFEPDPRRAITFNLNKLLRYTANYHHMMANRIDVIDMACEEYSQEVLGFSNVISSGNPTPYYDPIISTTSPTLTPFGDSDFLLFEEADSFLAIEDDPTSPEVDPTYYDPDGDILLLEAILNRLPPYINMHFLEGDNKLPVIIAKDLKNEEKAALIEVLKSHKRAIAWKLSDIKGTTQSFIPHNSHVRGLPNQRSASKAVIRKSTTLSRKKLKSFLTPD
ncbi:reverse transcriptase domain-containing protein [Tanacetum coccineum]